MRLAQFKSPKTATTPPRTNKDWAKLVEKRDNRNGIPQPITKT